jgi:D-glycero-D-manno-heptose 1,7-bisphosphate phosphatase
MFPAIFLDRDGVIIENRPAYVQTWEDVSIFPQALQALARASRTHYRIVIVTNQSGIGRGIISPTVAEDINRRLVEQISQAGGRVDRIYVCPHAPFDECDCRKPRPGLILQAAADLSLDLRQSVLIGDALSDLQAGLAAGIQHLILVRTGRGASQELLLKADPAWQITIHDSLAGALEDFFKVQQISF